MEHTRSSLTEVALNQKPKSVGYKRCVSLLLRLSDLFARAAKTGSPEAIGKVFKLFNCSDDVIRRIVEDMRAELREDAIALDRRSKFAEARKGNKQ